MRRFNFSILSLWMLAASGSPLWAGSYLSDDLLALAETTSTEAGAETAPPNFPLSNIKLFPGQTFRNNWRWELYAGAVEQHSHDETIVFVNYAMENNLTDDVTLAAVMAIYSVNQMGMGARDSAGIGFNLRLRDYFERGEGWQRFNEGFMGVAKFNRRTPALGTHFNFTWGFGTGIRWEGAKSGHTLVLAFRYQHVSNNGKDGENQNPGIDAFGGYFGFEVPF